MGKPGITILGASGMLGSAMVWHFRSRGWDVSALTRRSFDILADPIEQLTLPGGFVLNCAGVINKWNDVEQARPLLQAVNADFPHRLARHCSHNGARLIHFSTDCVFNGLRGQYTEADTPSAKDVYGQSKIEGEPPGAMVIRTSIVGPECQRFHSLLCWFLSQQSGCKGYVNHMWNGLTTLELARVVETIISDGLYAPGVQHFYSDDITKHDLLCLFNQHYGTDIPVAPFSTPEPRDMRLRSVRPDFVASMNIPPLSEQVANLPALSDRTGKWLVADILEARA